MGLYDRWVAEYRADHEKFKAQFAKFQDEFIEFLEAHFEHEVLQDRLRIKYDKVKEFYDSNPQVRERLDGISKPHNLYKTNYVPRDPREFINQQLLWLHHENRVYDGHAAKYTPTRNRYLPLSNAYHDQLKAEREAIS